jgi:hypothetical protein
MKASPVSSGEIRAGARAVEGAVDSVRGARGAARNTCCFVAGTLVDTEDGLRPIEEIEVGDRVWARDVETGETALQPVTDLIRRHERVIWDVELVAADGAHERFETTHDHPWWIAGRGWQTTEELAPGAAVVTRDGRGMVIVRVEQTDRVDATFNLTVDVFHTYFVGDQRVLVHNCNADEAITRYGERGVDGNSAERLAEQAADAEANGFPHGVSTTARPNPNRTGGSARRGDVEGAGFPVHNTGSQRRQHRTVELPKPVTQEVADDFNDIFFDE